MKIAILNAEAGGNKGAEAMLEVLISQLLENQPGCELYLEVGNKIKYYQEQFLPQFNNSKIHILLFKPKKIFNPYGRIISEISIAIDIGGINFTGNSVKANFRNLVRYFPFLFGNKKLVFFTQDFGPTQNNIVKTLGKFILNKSDKIFTRSLMSLNEVVNTFNVAKNKVLGPFPDATLIFHPKEKYDINFCDPYIILCPSAIMYSKYGESYLELFTKFYYEFKDDYRIVILVHNFTDNFGNSDESVCEQIHKSCPNSVLINKNISTRYLKNIQSNAVFSISSRYHVVVGSISQNVPSIAIGWNPKYESYLKLYQKENWNVDFNGQSFETARSIITNLNFESEKSNLDRINSELQVEVQNSFDLLLSLIESES